MLWTAAAWQCACAQGLTVVVFDYTGVPANEMAGAIRTARWAYRAAGIETSWTLCNFATPGSDACSQPLPTDGRYLELAVMPRRTGTLDTKLIRGEPAGLALRGADFLRPRAYVFYFVTKSAADLTLRPVGVVLGCVLVHESAHLLGLGHEKGGVMRGNINAQDLDAATSGRAFTADESVRLRAGVAQFEGRGLRAGR